MKINTKKKKYLKVTIKTENINDYKCDFRYFRDFG